MAPPKDFSPLPTVKCSSCGRQIEIIHMGNHVCGSGGGQRVNAPSPTDHWGYPRPNNSWQMGDDRKQVNTPTPGAAGSSRPQWQQPSRIPRPSHSKLVASSSAAPNESPTRRIPGPALTSVGPEQSRSALKKVPRGDKTGDGSHMIALGKGSVGFGVGRSTAEPIQSPRPQGISPSESELARDTSPRQALPRKDPNQHPPSYADEYMVGSPFSGPDLPGFGSARSVSHQSGTSLFDKLMADLQNHMDESPPNPPFLRNDGHDDVYASDYETPPSTPGYRAPSAGDQDSGWSRQHTSPVDKTTLMDNSGRGYSRNKNDPGDNRANRDPSASRAGDLWNATFNSGVRPQYPSSFEEPLLNTDQFRIRDESPPNRPSSSRGKCRACRLDITGKSVSSADGRLTGRYHKACFVCTKCSKPFDSVEFYVLNDEPYCELDYHALNGSLCGTCQRGIEGRYLEDEEFVKYHYSGCFCCDDCGRDLVDGYFQLSNKRVYCERHATRRVERAIAFAAARMSASNRSSAVSESSEISGSHDYSFPLSPSVSFVSTSKSQPKNRNQRRGRASNGSQARGKPKPSDGASDGGIRGDREREGKGDAEGASHWSREKVRKSGPKFDSEKRGDQTRDEDISRDEDAESVISDTRSKRSTIWPVGGEAANITPPVPVVQAPAISRTSSKSGGRLSNNDGNGHGPHESSTPASGQGLKRSQTERLSVASRDSRGASPKGQNSPSGGDKSAPSTTLQPAQGPPGKPKAGGRWLLPPPPLPPPSAASGPIGKLPNMAVLLQRRMTNVGMFISA